MYAYIHIYIYTILYICRRWRNTTHLICSRFCIHTDTTKHTLHLFTRVWVWGNHKNNKGHRKRACFGSELPCIARQDSTRQDEIHTRQDKNIQGNTSHDKTSGVRVGVCVGVSTPRRGAKKPVELRISNQWPRVLRSLFERGARVRTNQSN